MGIESISVNERRQVVLEIDGRASLIPDGVYRSDDGAVIAVSDGRIDDVVTVDSTAALTDLASSLADDLEESSGRIDLAVARIEQILTSFSLQYLALQNEMQQETRQFTAVSNVMKTKHETAKAAINNVR